MAAGVIVVPRLILRKEEVPLKSTFICSDISSRTGNEQADDEATNYVVYLFSSHTLSSTALRKKWENFEKHTTFSRNFLTIFPSVRVNPSVELNEWSLTFVIFHLHYYIYHLSLSDMFELFKNYARGDFSQMRCHKLRIFGVKYSNLGYFGQEWEPKIVF